MSEYIYDWTPSKHHAKEAIVRCRDCIYSCTYHDGIYRDGIECLGPLVQTWDYYSDRPLHNPVLPDGFCAWGKRKESA